MLTPAALHELLWAAHRTGQRDVVVRVMAVLMLRMAASAGWPWNAPVPPAPGDADVAGRVARLSRRTLRRRIDKDIDTAR